MHANARRGGAGLFQRGPVGIVVVVLHAVLIYALATSLGIVEVPHFAAPLDAVIIDVPQERTRPEPVPVMKPDLAQPSVETPPIEETIPEIEVPLDQPAPAAITAQTSDAPPVPESANMKIDRRVDPVYPAASRRSGEEGTGLYRVLVDETGHPRDVSVLRSSGFPRLDQAAITAIRRWVFSPALQGSRPIESWTKVQVTFQLNQ